MPNENLKGKKVTVMGLGLNQGGVGVVKYLVQQGAKVTVTDLKSKKDLEPSLKQLKGVSGVTYVFGQHRIEDFLNADLIVRSPGIKPSVTHLKKAKEKGIPIETAIGIFAQNTVGPIIGISGTRGKTTTTTLLYDMIKKENSAAILGGNIGISPLLALLKMKKGTPAVLELSSWQVEAMAEHKKSPHIAVLTNIYPDHLNHYESYEAYIEAKRLILKFQTPGDIAVLNYNDAKLREMAEGASARVVWFSTQKIGSPFSCFIEGKMIMFRMNPDEVIEVASVDDIRLPGMHNRENVLAATAAAIMAGVSKKTIQRVIKETKAIRNRLETIATKHGIEIINDTTSTMPQALMVALEAMSKPVVAIVGGNDKNVDYEEVTTELFEQTKDVVFLEGTATKKMLHHLEKLQKERGTQRHYAVVKNLQDAVTVARKSAEEGDVILFSPGATSFGMFQNEFDRGRAFEELISKL